MHAPTWDVDGAHIPDLVGQPEPLGSARFVDLGDDVRTLMLTDTRPSGPLEDFRLITEVQPRAAGESMGWIRNGST